MKVLHVLPSISSKLGGPTEVAINLVRELERQGVSTEIVTTDHDGSDRLAVPAHSLSRYREVPVWFFPRERFSRREFIPSRGLAGFLQRSIANYDLIDLHYLFTFSSSVAGSIARWRGVPYTVRTMGQLAPWSLNQRRILKKVYYSLFDRKLLDRAALVHCTTEGEAADVRAFGVNAQLEVLPLGVCETDIIVDAPTKMRRHFQIPLGAPVILFLSRLNEKKRPEVVIDLLATLQSQLLPHLIIAGAGSAAYEEFLRNRVAERGITDRVHFAGLVGRDQRNELLQGCDVFVLPSHSDNFALAVAEALEAGAAVITTSDVQISPDIKAAKCGIVLEDCERQLRDAIQELLSDSEKRRVFGERARQMAHSKYSWPSIVSRLIGSYERVLSKRGQPIAS